MNGHAETGASGKSFIFGIGSGRSGTLSLANVLNNQTGTFVTHEFRAFNEDRSLTRPHRVPIPWETSKNELDEAISAVAAYPYTRVGDVASFWLPHLPYVFTLGAPVRVVVLWRARNEVVESFEKHVGDKNHWMKHDGKKWRLEPNWDRAFPKMEAATRAEAIGKYWDLYYDMANELALGFPDSVRIWPVNVLNDRRGLREMLEFVGIPRKNQRLSVALHRNRSQRTLIGFIRGARRRILRY